jgi:hypothetical protein
MGNIIFEGQSPFDDFPQLRETTIVPQVEETTVSLTDADTVRMTLKVDILGKRPERCSVPILMNWKVAMALMNQLGSANNRAAALRAEQRGGGETA